MEARLKQLEDQVPAIQAEIDFLKIRYLSSDQIVNEARTCTLTGQSLSEKRSEKSWSTSPRRSASEMAISPLTSAIYLPFPKSQRKVNVTSHPCIDAVISRRCRPGSIACKSGREAVNILIRSRPSMSGITKSVMTKSTVVASSCFSASRP
jgi:hypothetical protein